ncbi:hypothetical protein M1L60_38640 [Actinoplanes sp. TRM 88003]|uniref:Uncharacterized protein n=1 Tax=Paractinoplanes aksuensis TaxID=2939490 RepID=A0ABT1E082_9ACTN|nr:hypothetical protein [Actinoplanes aksuensis]MCO8276512.1 hypothetical protein [Actinoplanes aksuensis]
MPALAATATPETTMIAVLIAAAVIATLCYGIGCWLWPFGACRKCDGSGKRRSPFGRAFGLCRRCHGDGRRLRIGRRILNNLRELHDKGTR